MGSDDRLQGKKKEGKLALARQLIGNHDEVTDLRLIGPPKAPTHLALATNSPAMRVFDIQTLNCTATLAGHTDTVLVLDATRTKGTASSAQHDYIHILFLARFQEWLQRAQKVAHSLMYIHDQVIPALQSTSDGWLL